MTEQIKIAAAVQENGVYGMPLNCVSMDNIPPETTDENWKKHSAICAAIGQKYPSQLFEILFTNKHGFVVKLRRDGIRIIDYSNFRLIGNVLEGEL